MLTLGGLSAVGFGGYRISAASRIHSAALRSAICAGCNLVDTAPNYTNGESEALIGAVLSEARRETIFVTTKVGYVTDDDAGFFRDCPAARAQIVRRNDALHCIHPAYVRHRALRSLERMGLDYVDGIFLHNPEYHAASGEDYGTKIAAALEALEQLVAQKVIRYFGVSSNALPGSHAGGECTVDFYYGRTAARPPETAFRLVQFPFNVFEAAAADAGAGPSLLQRSRQLGLVTLANRPLNAMHGGTRLRLAAPAAGPRAAIRPALREVVRLLDGQVGRAGASGSVGDLEAIETLARALPQLSDTEAVAALMRTCLVPVVQALYAERLPPDLAAALAVLEQGALAQARANMSKLVGAAIDRERLRPELASADYPLLQQQACHAVLAAGAGHVLVGMRRPEYVGDFAPFFRIRGRAC
ncbi:MAG: aldo/keto reductase [Rhizomicrobium sp.]